MIELARQIIAISQGGDKTPVIVIPKEFSLKPDFFAHLVDHLYRLAACPVSLDLLPRQSRWPLRASVAAGWFARKIRQRLRRMPSGNELAAMAKVEPTWIVSQPMPVSADRGRIMLGCCHGDQTLPSWAIPIPLFAQPCLPQHATVS